MSAGDESASKTLSTPIAVYILRLCCLFEAAYYLFRLLRSLERHGISALSFDSLHFVLGLSSVFLLPLLVLYCTFKPSSTARSCSIGLLVAALAATLWYSLDLFRYVLLDIAFIESLLSYGWSALAELPPIVYVALRSMLRMGLNLLLLLFCFSASVKTWFDAYGGKVRL